MDAMDWNKDFERNMNHNYMVLSQYDFFEQPKNAVDYRCKMLLENKIEGLLPVTHHVMNAQERYYYEINSLQSLESLYEKREMNYQAIQGLLLGCIRLFHQLEEYLLDGSQILLKPEYIYLHMETMQPLFTYYPAYEGDVRQAFTELTDYILTKIDHTDERAVMLGYQVYRHTRNSNFVLEDIRDFMTVQTQNMKSKKTVKLDKEVNTLERQTDRLQNMDRQYRVNYIEDTSKDHTEVDWEEMQEEEAEDNNIERNTDKDTDKNKKQPSDFLGVILCIAIAVAAGFLLLTGRVLMLFTLSSKQSLYLCGAMTMSFVAAVLFLVSLTKKRREWKEIEELEQETYEEYLPEDLEEQEENIKPQQVSAYAEIPSQQTLHEDAQTMLLSECHKSEEQQEHLLKGFFNGKEILIPLKKLPCMIGKKADMVDVPIADDTVSRVHARIDEREGKYYVSDLNSTNGTLYNGTLLGIHEEVELTSGDEVQFGNSSFVFI